MDEMMPILASSLFETYPYSVSYWGAFAAHLKHVDTSGTSAEATATGAWVALNDS